MESFTSKNEINTLKSEHLTNGERPIMASVEGYGSGTALQFSAVNKHLISEEKKKWETKNVDYKDSYAISSLSEKNKVSTGYIMCTGMAGVGRDKWTDKNISFLSHQFPGIFLPGESLHEKFVADLHERLEELKEKCIPGSVDIVIVGGDFPSFGTVRYENRYIDSVDLLKNEVSKTFGFDPVVITGPKLSSCEIPDNTELVFLDTENRRLHISRPKTGDSSAESYMPCDTEPQAEKWRSEVV